MSDKLKRAYWYKSNCYLSKENNRKLALECWRCLPDIKRGYGTKESFLEHIHEGYLCISTGNRITKGAVVFDSDPSDPQNTDYVVLQDYLNPQPTFDLE